MKKTVVEQHFVIFIDNIFWATDNLGIDYPTTVIENGSEIYGHKKRHLMSLCEHNISANSTFSWWEGWLGDGADLMVIAPKYWFAKPENNIKRRYLVAESGLRAQSHY